MEKAVQGIELEHSLKGNFSVEFSAHSTDSAIRTYQLEFLILSGCDGYKIHFQVYILYIISQSFPLASGAHNMYHYHVNP